MTDLGEGLIPGSHSALRAQLAGERIILGDQSPWAGGLLRWKAIHQLLGKNALYAIQDVDTPWVQQGRRPIRSAQGWAPYFSLASKYPWTLSAPEAEMPRVLDSLGAPRGLRYLLGPSTNETLGSLSRQGLSSVYTDHLAAMLSAEKEWAEGLADQVGLRPLALDDWPKGDCHAITRTFAMMLNLGPVRHFSDLYRSGELQQTNAFPTEMYWHLDSHGRREESGSSGTMKFPRGMALPLELAANGYILACTSLPYLNRVLEQRDRHLKGVTLRLLRVTFDWRLDEVDPIRQLVEAFRARKQKRNQAVPVLDTSTLDAIHSYWKQRPTLISWLVLGGSLKPQLELLEL